MAEDVRIQVRKIHQASIKKGKYEKHSIELEEVRDCLLRRAHTNHFTVPKTDGQECCRGRQDLCADEEGGWNQVDHQNLESHQLLPLP
jgi:hypothetical protein